MPWTPLCLDTELSEKTAKSYPLEGLSYFIIKSEGQVYAYLNSCPHRKIELEWQENSFFDDSKDYLQCATHGALFLPHNGYCITGPCFQKTLTSIETKLIDGRIHINLTNILKTY